MTTRIVVEVEDAIAAVIMTVVDVPYLDVYYSVLIAVESKVDLWLPLEGE